MLDKVFALGKALRYGEELANAATWKNRQVAVNAVAGLLGAALVFLPLGVSHEEIQSVAAAVAIVGGVLNAYLTAATSKKVGVQTGGGNPDDPHADTDNVMG